MSISIPLSSDLSPLLLTHFAITSLALYTHSLSLSLSLSLLFSALSYDTTLGLSHKHDTVDDGGMGICIVPPPKQVV